MTSAQWELRADEENGEVLYSDQVVGGEGMASLQSSQLLPQAPWSPCFAGLSLCWAQQSWGLWAELAEPPSQDLVLCVARFDLERVRSGGSGQTHLTQHIYKV